MAGVTPDPTKRYTTLLVAYMHPFTRGRVHITSTNPKAHPDLDPKYLANPADSGVLTSMISFMRRLLKTSPIAESIQSVTVPPFDEDTPIEEVNRFVADTLATVHHPVGTASMLPKELGGVVDNRLRVYGSENLRVVRIRSLSKNAPIKLKELIKGRLLHYSFGMSVVSDHLTCPQPTIGIIL